MGTITSQPSSYQFAAASVAIFSVFIVLIIIALAVTKGKLVETMGGKTLSLLCMCLITGLGYSALFLNAEATIYGSAT